MRRRRRCVQCEQPYATVEHLDPALTAVITRHGSREMFDRTRIEASLAAASNYSLSHTQTAELIDQVEDALYASGPIVSSAEIGKAILQTLRTYDYRMYARYALQLIRPQSVEEFLDWVDQNPTSDEGDGALAPFRVLDDSGVQRQILRDEIFGEVRNNTRSRRNAIPESAINDVTTQIMSNASEIATSREQQFVTSAELAKLIADSLLELDELSYLNYIIFQKSIDSNSKLDGEMRAVLDSAREQKSS